MPEVKLTDRQREMREGFISERGYWNPFWEGLLSLDERFFESYLNFSAVPWRNGVLEPKIKELIYTAIDASTTHLYEPGLRQHQDFSILHIRYRRITGSSEQKIFFVSN